jgi:hypothetical protein
MPTPTAWQYLCQTTLVAPEMGDLGHPLALLLVELGAQGIVDLAEYLTAQSHRATGALFSLHSCIIWMRVYWFTAIRMVATVCGS